MKDWETSRPLSNNFQRGLFHIQTCVFWQTSVEICSFMTAKLCITWWVIDLGWNPIQILSSELDMINKVHCFPECTGFKIKGHNTAFIIDDQNVNPALPPLQIFISWRIMRGLDLYTMCWEPKINGGGTNGKPAVSEACPCVMGGENSGSLCGEQKGAEHSVFHPLTWSYPFC